MNLATQSKTQVYSPFGTYVVEQHSSGSDHSDRRHSVPEFDVCRVKAGPSHTDR